MSTDPNHAKRHLKAHFGFTRMPFSKFTWAAHMFDSAAQRELRRGLLMWTEIRGLALVTGQTGVGKSITLRSFVKELAEARFKVFDFTYLPTTVTGFLRSLARKLGLPMRLHTADLFDDVQKRLITFQGDRGPHPILLIDDGEGLNVQVLDVLRRLTCYDLDAEDRFSLLLSGTDQLLTTVQHHALAPLRTRVAYAQTLRPFGVEDTRNYVRHHLERVEVDPRLFTDQAVQRLFHASAGNPRRINQLATQTMIQAAVTGRDAIDGDFVAQQIATHPLYKGTRSER